MTLIEIMVVLVIVGMLAGAMAWNVFKARERASQQIARNDARALANAVRAYWLRKNHLPESLDQLVPGEIERLRRDPWGTPFVYARTGDSFEVLSYGPDRVQGGGDDISTDEPDDG